jgi:hypothetical protein
MAIVPVVDVNFDIIELLPSPAAEDGFVGST